ncbi:unnamed protein product [Didymodactylos carnosus]|uniref:Uncharacterized protein n=1 Tax=Didymodactylos carnosus TaxID=1234261 RepID=A0A815YBA3_9BILA|nr:unnamed protein product [Didymodactylos carnosus]CAF4431139.1 unnamed protein product [Didymodactylos carnosus]
MLTRTLLNMSQTGNAKQDVINIDDFDKNYDSKEAILWYTRDSFLCKLLNKAFRTENIDIIFKFRFFIIDLHYQLSRLHAEFVELLQENFDYFTVFRAQQVPLDEL